MSDNDGDGLWTPKHTAEILGIALKTLDTWRYRGQGPPYLVLVRRVRYEPAAVRAWLASRKVSPS